MNATLFALDAPSPSHPAKYTNALLLTMAKICCMAKPHP